MTGPSPGLPSLRERNGELLMGVRVIPSAPRDALRGVYGDRLKVAVSAPPEHGKANDRVIHALAAWLDVRIESIRVQTGHAGRDKVVAFSGIEQSELRDRLCRLLQGGPAEKGREHGS